MTRTSLQIMYIIGQMVSVWWAYATGKIMLWNHYQSWGSITGICWFRGSLKPQKLKSNKIQFSLW